MVALAAADERAHAPGAEPSWCESWSFDFVAAPDSTAGDRATGGYVRLTYFPNLGRAWYWAYLVGPDLGLVVVRDHEVPLPHRSEVLEIRADALWAELVCECPFEHWGLAAEAFGLRLDDPLQVVRDPGRDEWGERIAVGLDLEWELIAPVAELGEPGSGVSSSSGRYSQAGRVHGTVLVGPDEVRIDGFGVRAHAWGVVPERPSQRITGASAATAFELTATADVGSAGWSWEGGAPSSGLRTHPIVGVSSERDPDLVPRRTHWSAAGGLEVQAEVVALTAVPMGPDRPPILRALCALERDPWWAWAEWS
jgi:hypothetical protein